jgi:uncharacterized protein (TIGR02466 family)
LTDERYHITKKLARTKVDNLGEIWTYPALHIFHGIMSEKIVKDVIECCTKARNDDRKINITGLAGTQSILDIKDPLMVEFIETMMRAACIFVEQCEMVQKPKRIEVDEIWDVRMESGNYTPMHIHNTDSKKGLSSIFYLKVPKSFRQAEFEGDKKKDYSFKRDGWLKFLWGLVEYQNPDTFACPTNAYVLPQVGHFFVFPKSLIHMVYPYNDTEDRWSVQINFNLWEKE